MYDLGQIDGDQRTRGLAVERVADNTRHDRRSQCHRRPTTSQIESKSETFSFHLSEQSKKLVETTTLDDSSNRFRTFFQIRAKVFVAAFFFGLRSRHTTSGFESETYVRHRLETFQSEETLELQRGKDC